MTLFDVHSHALPTMSVPTRSSVARGWLEIRETDNGRQVWRTGTLVRELHPAAWDAAARLEAMDHAGIAEQVVSPAPFAFLYDADPRLTADFASELNGQLAALCAEQPARLIGFGSVPLQDPARAVAELRHAIGELGLAGIEIGSNAGDLQLHDAALEPFFAEVERLDIPLLLHPGPLDLLARTGHNGLAFALARPIETELAIGALIHGGVLERHPALRICVCHGGAGVPALAGRWHAGWQRRTPGVRAGSDDPRVLLGRLWADTLTYDPHTLPLVARTFGSSHLMVGTDFPFVAQETPAGAAVSEAATAGLPDIPGNWQEVLAANARDFLRGARFAHGQPGKTPPDPRPAVGT